ncbi:hypothetical protein [Xanthomonas phage vB_XooS_NR08]|nr:hypothetical protein [Xanthomonas phage vB_XooS_NR08]
MNARANVGKLQRVFAPHYLTLRAQWPQAFAIKPTRGGYEAVVFIEEGVSEMADNEHPDYVTVTSGMRGYFAVYLKWNPEHGGFYEPWNTGETCRNHAEAVADAKAWAQAEEVEYR